MTCAYDIGSYRGSLQFLLVAAAELEASWGQGPGGFGASFGVAEQNVEAA